MPIVTHVLPEDVPFGVGLDRGRVPPRVPTVGTANATEVEEFPRNFRQRGGSKHCLSRGSAYNCEQQQQVS